MDHLEHSKTDCQIETCQVDKHQLSALINKNLKKVSWKGSSSKQECESRYVALQSTQVLPTRQSAPATMLPRPQSAPTTMLLKLHKLQSDPNHPNLQSARTSMTTKQQSATTTMLPML